MSLEPPAAKPASATEVRTMSPNRDHLFISYATEDADFAEWLELKLVASGFQVWRDGSKLLGGEPFPQKIDEALKQRAFRVLAILSPSSIGKPNPTKERALAQNLARERQEPDFLIPLNLTGLSPTELDWMTSDLSSISFSPSWFDGLNRLLKKLGAIATPRHERADLEALTSWLSLQTVPASRRETLYSNVFQIRTMPATVLRIRSESTPLAPLFGRIPYSRQTDNLFWSFFRPPQLPSGTDIVEVTWSSPFEDLPREELERKVVRLLRLHIWQFCDQKGLIRAREENKTYSYFSSGRHEDRRIPFTTYSGRKTSLKVTGTRTFRTGAGQRESCRYHLAPDFTPVLKLFHAPALVLRFHIFLTDHSGKQLDAATAHRRRRRLGKALMNHQWFIRQLAVMEYLSSGTDTLSLSIEYPDSILVSSAPFLGATTVGISNPREGDLPEELDERLVLDESDEFDEPYLEA